MKKYILLIMTIMTALSLVACGSGEKQDNTKRAGESSETTGGTLNIAYAAQPQTLDPHMSLAQATADVVGNVYETLLTIDNDREIQPMLAEEYEVSADGKEIVFHLREGIKFHNGEEMIAEDVVASMNRWKDNIGGREQFNEAIFEEVDEYTVVLKLPEPLSTAISVIAFQGPSFAAIMPKEVIDDASAKGVEDIIGTGPFVFDEWVQDQHITISRYADYQSREEPSSGLAGAKDAKLDEVIFNIATDSSTRVAGVQTGEYDLVNSIPADMADMLANDANLEASVQPYGFVTATFNKKKGFFTDQKAREAVNIGIDREAILIGAFNDAQYYTVDSSIMMQNQTEWDTAIDEEVYTKPDVERAKQLLKEAGYDGEEITLIVTRDYIEQYNSAVVMQSQLENLGLKVNLEVYDWPTLLDKTEDPDAYDIYVLTDLVTPEPTSHLYMLPDFAGWTDSPELQDVIASFRSKNTLEEAREDYDALVEAYYDYVPIVKVGDINNLDYYRTNINGFDFQDRFILWNVTKE